MGDRTQVGVRFYNVPEDQELRDRIMGILEGNGGWAPEYAEADPFTETCYDPEVSLGSTDGMHAELQELIKETGVEFAYDLTEAPKYEYLGQRHVYVPGAGYWFSGSTDDDGQTVLNETQILDLLTGCEDLDDFKAKLDKKTGGDVIRALGEFIVEELRAHPAWTEGPPRQMVSTDLDKREGRHVEVSVTRSAGTDGAVVVFIDTTFEPGASDGGPGLRVLINDHDTYAGVAYSPTEDGEDGHQYDTKRLRVDVDGLVDHGPTAP